MYLLSSLLSAFIIVVILPSPTTSQQEPVISYISKERIASLGESVELICETAYSSGYSVQWIKKTDSGPSLLSTGSSASIPSNRISVSVNNDKYILKIDKIVENDQGTYLCRIQMPSSKSVQAEVNVTVRIPPVITDDSSRHVVTSINASEVVLKCFANGYPEPRISWRREKNRLLPNNRAYSIGQELHIHNITKDHQGTYFCVADNGVGGDRRAISVEVEYPPIVKVVKERVGQALTYNQDLVCIVEAFPSAAISWVKQGDQDRDLINNRNYNISIFPTNNEFISTTILRVRRIEKRNYGDYRCEASNKLGKSVGHVELFETQNIICPPDCSPLNMPYNSSVAIAPSSMIVYLLLIMKLFMFINSK